MSLSLLFFEKICFKCCELSFIFFYSKIFFFKKKNFLILGPYMGETDVLNFQPFLNKGTQIKMVKTCCKN